MPAWVKVSGTWRQVAPDGLYTKVSGTWRTVDKGYVKISGTWRQFHQRSDPITVTFNPIWTASYQEASPYAKAAYTFVDPANDLIQGDWDTVGVSGGMQRATGVMRFDQSAIIAALGGRNVVSSATLRLTVNTQYTSSGIHPYIYGADASAPASEPANLNGGIVRVGSPVQGSRTTDENSVTTPITALAQSIVSGSYYGFSVYNSGTDNTAKELYRGSFYGTSGSTAQKPLLSITADFI